MSNSELAERLADFFVEVGKGIARVLKEPDSRRRLRANALSWLIVVVFVTQVWVVYSNGFVKHITVYMADPGSFSYRTASLIADEIRESKDSWARYDVRIVPVPGSDDIEDRLAADRSGTEIGIIQDRWVHSLAEPRDGDRNLSVLLPVGLDHLHVLCSRRFLAFETDLFESGQPGPDSPAIRLSQVINELKGRDGRIYLGPVHSATRRLSEHVLTHFGAEDPDRLAAHAIQNWYDLRSAFLRDHIDMAFFLGPIKSYVIDEIAKDRSVVLVSLHDDHRPLVNGEEAAWLLPINPFKYEEPAHPPVARPEKLPPEKRERWERTQRISFCPRELKTLASRHVLAASASMSAADAFAISKAAYLSLIAGEKIEEDTWLDSEPPKDPSHEHSGKGISSHNGAVLSRADLDRPRWPWLGRPEVKVFFGSMVLFLLGELIKVIRPIVNRWGETPARLEEMEDVKLAASNAAPPAGPHDLNGAFLDLEKELNSFVEQEIKVSPQGVDEETWKRRNEWMRTWRNRVLSACQEKRIETDDADALLFHHREADDLLRSTGPGGK